MKNEIKNTLKTALLTTLIILVVLLSIKSVKYFQEARKQPKTVYVTEYVTDTITNVVYDTVLLEHYKTQKLYLTDTVTNTIIKDSLRIDSVFVQIPIYSYRLDTSFVTDTTVFNLSIRNSGSDVSLDTLSYSFQYTPTLPKKTHRTGWFIGPSLGLGYDFTTGKPVPTIGFGAGYGISTKKY